MLHVQFENVCEEVQKCIDIFGGDESGFSLLACLVSIRSAEQFQTSFRIRTARET